MENEIYMLRVNSYTGFSIHVEDELGNESPVASHLQSVDEALKELANRTGKTFSIQLVEIK